MFYVDHFFTAQSILLNNGIPIRCPFSPSKERDGLSGTLNCRPKHGLSPSRPVPLRTQNLTTGACISDVEATTMDFDAQGNIRYSEKKAGYFTEFELYS